MTTDKPAAAYQAAPGPDVDLENEVVRDRQGRRITRNYVDTAVTEVRAKPGRGRPALSEQSGQSPQVTFRLPPAMRRQAEVQARKEGTPVSQVARKALQEYLERHETAS
jgi:hypothetical protein